MQSVLFGPRPVTRGSRRVCLPKALTRGTAMAPGQWVTVAPAPARPGELLVRPATRGAEAPRAADMRQVNSQGQVTIPGRLMAEVGIDSGQARWVYFSRAGAGIRIIPSTLVAHAREWSA